jgi:heme exporter protein CcmD
MEHGFFIIASYVASVLALATLTGVTVLSARAARKRVEALEEGASNRATAPGTSR